MTLASLLGHDDTADDRALPIGLPPWVQHIRPHQWTAVDAILDAFTRVPVVMLDAPTGAGKTLIAEMVRLAFEDQGQGDGLYICSDKALQDQFVTDFDHAKVLKGRANYPTERALGDRSNRTTADDCTGGNGGAGCWHCPNGHAGCPYQLAKAAAIDADLAVLNTAYLLAEANSPNTAFGGKNKRSLVVIDECDTLEDQLMNYVEFTVPRWIGQRLGLIWPVKGARKPTLKTWLTATATQVGKAMEDGAFRDQKEKRRLQQFGMDCWRVAEELQRDIDAGHHGDGAPDSDAETGRWLRDYDTQTFCLKPVVVGPYGTRRLWRHGKHFLLMSGTIISADDLADATGLPMDFEVVSVPMTFPVEHRPVIVAPIANITRASTDDEYEQLAYAVRRILEVHEGERVLIHTVSFKLAEYLMSNTAAPGRRQFSYRTARDKEQALADYRRTPGAVMYAPSMDRGVDLPGDLCRVVVIAKVPFPSLGDRRVSARLRLPGGQSWYAVQTVRKIVQMTGRGVRSADDHAVSYILDRQFVTNTWSKNKSLFPGWWREALQMNSDVRWLMSKWDGRVNVPTADDIWQQGEQ